MISPRVVLVHIVDDCGNVMEKKRETIEGMRVYAVWHCGPCRKYGKNHIGEMNKRKYC